MRKRSASATLVASPVLVGAVTVLIAIVAVFIAYGANNGLPFVPTYDLKAEVPSGNKLVKGNEVRIGGFRVGVVTDIKPRIVNRNGKATSIAVLQMKLDKKAEPLARDTTVRIRPRSALGLKYVQLTPGKSRRTFLAGDTMPLRSASQPLELEDVFSTFDGKTRRNVQGTLTGFGDAFAGRGQSINTAIQALNPLLRSLTPVMQTLNDPATGLNETVVQLGATMRQLASVSTVTPELFANMATTFAAINTVPRSLQETIERTPSTLDVGVRSFRVQRPFLGDAAELAQRLRPAVRQLPRSLPSINSALGVGTPVLPRTVKFSGQLGDSLDSLNDLFKNPNTLLALGDLRTTVTLARPALEFIAPYQTVCNYANYFLFPLGEHQSQVSPLGGTVQEQGARLPNVLQPNSQFFTTSSRPIDTRPGEDPIGSDFNRYFATPNMPAIDAQGNADCQSGQNGYPKGRLSTIRVGPGLAPDGSPSGGNSPITDSDYPILSGGTYVSRKLGLNNLKDVDKLK